MNIVINEIHIFPLFLIIGTTVIWKIKNRKDDLR